jgi:hypothetical protein
MRTRRGSFGRREPPVVIARCIQVVLTVVVLFVGCSSCDGSSGGSVSDQETEYSQLMKRPDSDQAAARYGEILAKVREQLSAVSPSVKGWTSAKDGTAGGCNDFPDVGFDGEFVSTGNWYTQAPMPEGDWARAVQAVDKLVRAYGFDSGPVTAVDRPGNHYVAFYDEYRAELVISGGHTLGVLLMSGCHLTTAAKERGHPEPTSTY